MKGQGLKERTNKSGNISFFPFFIITIDILHCLMDNWQYVLDTRINEIPFQLILHIIFPTI